MESERERERESVEKKKANEHSMPHKIFFRIIYRLY